MSRNRLDSGNEVELGVGINYSTTPKVSKASQKSKKTSLKEQYQSIGLIAMVICFIIIGFQMTTNDAYSKKIDNVISVNDAIDTPSPTNHQIELMIHEDDGDVEVDVPDQLPPDLQSSFNQNLNPNSVPNQNQFISLQQQQQQQQAPNAQQTQIQHGTTLTIRRTQTNNNDSSSAPGGPRMITPVRREPLNYQHQYGTTYNGNTQRNNAISPNDLQRIAQQLQQGQGQRQRQGKGRPGPKGRNRPKPVINIRGDYHTQENLPEKLPTVEEMKANATRRFYDDINKTAQIYGSDLQCPANDNDTCDGKQRQFTIISGLYNTGTNVAYKLIAQNCMTKLKFQPGWGKHEIPSQEKIEWWNEHPMENSPKGIYERSILLVVIKDPLTWMKSMCKANYDFRYMNRTWFFENCPTGMEHSEFNWLPLNRGKVMNRNHTSNGMFKSPIHLWNEWYSSLVDGVDGSKYPYLVVRFEDLLFRAESVIPQFCRCLGYCKYKRGKDDNNIMIADEASKPHGHPRNRTMSFWSYSNPEYRYEGYTKEDLEFMLDAVNSTLLEKFGYEFDVEKTKRMRM